MASGLRKKSKDSPATSDVHKGRPCASCILCAESPPVYTHPIKWKNTALYSLLRELEPDKNIEPESCVCTNCRNSLIEYQSDKENFQPRWSRQSKRSNDTCACDIPECSEPASRSTKLIERKKISAIIDCAGLPEADPEAQTNLCDVHALS